MTRHTYDRDELHKLWQQTIDPHGVGMPVAIADDIGSYRGESVESVLEKMAVGKNQLRDLWNAANVDTSNPKSVEAFYHEQFIEAYELADWHCGRTNRQPPLNYARAASVARRLNLRRALDFGSGIGTGSLCLAAAGCEVDSADVNRALLGLVRHRFIRRGLTPQIIDLTTGTRPRRGYYDLITCFDVLEHIPDQYVTLRELTSYWSSGDTSS